MLELPRGGKIRAQDAAVERAGGEILAFSDANALWEPDALRALVGAVRRPRASATSAARCASVNDGGTNQEGLYWRYEMWLRALESRLASVTGGNGAIYAMRREAYLASTRSWATTSRFPFNMVKRGWRAVYAPAARATEKMVPTIEGEFARKRRMMSHAWPIVLRGGLLSPRGYPPLYALMIASHRLLRYATPVPARRRAGRQRARCSAQGWVYVAHLRAPARAARGGARRARACRVRPLLVARYYVLTTASIAAGLWDWLRHGTPAGWAPPEGTR